MDPSSRRELWENLAQLKAAGMTIVVSTAYMDEADRCDRVGMMKSGRFLTVDSPRTIISGFGKKLLAVRSDNMFTLLKDLRSMDIVSGCYTFGDTHHVTLVSGADAGADAVKRTLAEKFGHTGVEVREVPATLEDCYMNLEEK